MRFWQIDSALQVFFARTVTVLLATAILLGAQTPARADTEPKRVLLLHSFGPRFKPWSDYAQAIRSKTSQQWHRPIDFLEQSLVNARQDDEPSEAAFVGYLRALYTYRPVDLIVAIGAPAAAFIQRNREQLFPTTPMVLTAVEQRRIQHEKLSAYDTVVAVAHDFPAAFDDILHVLPLTKTIAIVNGASPNETFWLEEMRRELAPLAGRVELRWYNDKSFEDILVDAARLPPHSAIFWHLMNIDAAGVAHEANDALNKLSSTANAPIFSYDRSFFGEVIVGGPMHSSEELGRITAAASVRILNGEKPGDIKIPATGFSPPVFDWRQMHRWGIDERDLPPQSTVYFRQPSIWEEYPAQFAFVVAVVLAQAGLIMILLREHRQRQFAEVQSRQRMTELAHVNRFSTAGELTASIAHEINQPLGSILTNAETADAILKSPTPDIAELRDIVNDILQDDRRASEVIRRMRSLLRKAPFESKSFDLNDLARETVAFLRSLATARNFQLRTSITPDALPIMGDRVQLQQVILNLVVNAIDAMNDTRTEERIIGIRTWRVENFAELSVSDRGPGIPAGKLKEVFEPFFTTKAEGMGMGLSIGRTIVEAHNGQISAVNEPGAGATFRIRLPIAHDAAPPVLLALD